MNDIVKMGTDLYFKKNLKFSAEESQDIFNKALIADACQRAGLAVVEKLDYKTYSNPMFKYHLFNLVSETIEAIVPKVISDQFNQFAEIRNANWGDQLIFEVTSPDLFSVAKVARGTTNVRKQRLDSRSLALNPVMREVKIGEELFRVLQGVVDWAVYVNKIALSMATQIKTEIYTAIYGAYNGSDATYFTNGAFSPTTFNTMVAHVQAACGGLKPIVFGTKIALSKVTPSAGFTSYNMMDQINMSGYLGNFQGTQMVELEQAHTPGTDNFAISDNFLLVVPSGADKIVRLGFEGDTIVVDNSGVRNADLSIEYSVQKAWDMGVLASGKFGIYQVS